MWMCPSGSDMARANLIDVCGIWEIFLLQDRKSGLEAREGVPHPPILHPFPHPSRQKTQDRAAILAAPPHWAKVVQSTPRAPHHLSEEPQGGGTSTTDHPSTSRPRYPPRIREHIAKY